MARRRTSVEQELHRIKERLSRRLAVAMDEGRLAQEMKAICKEGRAAWRASANGTLKRHGRDKRKRG
jgi:hypothetical protein